MQIRLDDQVAIVTGGDSGLGRGVAVEFARAGAAVVVNYHSDADSAAEVVDEIAAFGGRAIAVKGDVSNEHDVDQLFDTALDTYGAVDLLMANAGLQKDGPIAGLSLADWQTVIDTNLTGQFLCARAAIRVFRQQGNRGVARSIGKILCMSSVHEVIPWSGHANYAASKGGVGMLMRTLAQEVASDRIRINSIAPGAIRTAINADAFKGDGAAEVLRLIPYGRIGDSIDVANLAVFLASDLADYIVGATVFIDGGMTLYPEFRDNG
jgi:glucose 1-dehydrogenase